MNEFGKYRLFRKYFSSDGVNYTPLDEYQALLVENNSCQCGYRELEYRFDGEYKNDTFNKYEIWNEYSFCPTDSSYDELTGNVDYRNPIPNEGVMIATYKGNGSNSVKLCNSTSFFQNMAINNTELGSKTKAYTFNNTDINEVAYSNVTSNLYKCFSGCTGLISVEIPDSVPSISKYAFAICQNLKSVTIGSGVTSIDNYAFDNCISLTSITIPNSVETIGEESFKYCTGLTSIVIPDSVTEIGINSFASCYGLTSINIGNGVKSFSMGSFCYCKSLTSIVIPDNVTNIGSGAFRGCSSLNSVTIGSGVTYIGNDSFRDCTSLTYIVIPDSVTRIGSSSFSGCTSLTSIEIPDSVTRIDSCAFSGCTSLNSITCYATTAPTLVSNSQGFSYVFDRLPTNGTLHVPNGSNYSSWLRQLPSGWTIEYI